MCAIWGDWAEGGLCIGWCKSCIRWFRSLLLKEVVWVPAYDLRYCFLHRPTKLLTQQQKYYKGEPFQSSSEHVFNVS